VKQVLGPPGHYCRRAGIGRQYNLAASPFSEPYGFSQGQGQRRGGPALAATAMNWSLP